MLVLLALLLIFLGWNFANSSYSGYIHSVKTCEVYGCWSDDPIFPTVQIITGVGMVLGGIALILLRNKLGKNFKWILLALFLISIGWYFAGGSYTGYEGSMQTCQNYDCSFEPVFPTMSILIGAGMIIAGLALIIQGNKIDQRFKPEAIYPIASFVLAFPFLFYGFFFTIDLLFSRPSWATIGTYLTPLFALAIPLLFFFMAFAYYKKSKNAQTVIIMQVLYEAFLVFWALILVSS